MVQDTSKMCYKELIQEGFITGMQKRVFTLILQYPQNNDRIIAEIGHLRINQVTARRNELCELGLVEDGGIEEDKDTGRSCHVWHVPIIVNYTPKPKKGRQVKLKRFT